MMSAMRKKAGFGAPEDFSMAMLPTYEEVGKQFLQCQNDLKAETKKLWVPNIDVSNEVKKFIRTTK